MTNTQIEQLGKKLANIINWPAENPEEFQECFGSDVDSYIDNQLKLIGLDLYGKITAILTDNFTKFTKICPDCGSNHVKVVQPKWSGDYDLLKCEDCGVDWTLELFDAWFE